MGGIRRGKLSFGFVGRIIRLSEINLMQSKFLLFRLYWEFRLYVIDKLLYDMQLNT